MWFNTIKLIQKLKAIWSYFRKKEASLAISEALNFKIFRGSMPPESPRLAPPLENSFRGRCYSNVCKKLSQISTASNRQKHLGALWSHLSPGPILALGGPEDKHCGIAPTDGKRSTRVTYLFLQYTNWAVDRLKQIDLLYVVNRYTYIIWLGFCKEKLDNVQHVLITNVAILWDLGSKIAGK